jgi:lipopolysaccharide transport system permease protein
MIGDESIRALFLLNPMHSFVNFYRELILLGEFSLVNFEIIVVVSLLSYLLGGWVFMKIKLAFGDVL